MNQSRVRPLNNLPFNTGPILYWMIRDQRVHDNWALIYAQQQALKQNQPLHVVFSLRKDLTKHFGTARLIDFMLTGLEEVERECRKLNIQFSLLLSDSSPEDEVLQYVKAQKIGMIVTDFSPLRNYRLWKENLVKRSTVPIFEVDAHNIVPCWIASDKQEFAARTFRPKILKKLDEYLDEFPKIKKMEDSKLAKPIDWQEIREQIQVDETVKAINWLKPGSSEANKMLQTFLENKIENEYAELRNNPNEDVLSNLSPYLHFGQISTQRVVLDTMKQIPDSVNRKSFLEELIVRRELSDNFCFYNKNYDSFEGFADWAKKSLNEHRADKREHLFTLEELEHGKTHEALWNASQMQMVKTGKMHGYLRMYWAKKILEWTKSPEDAMQIAIHLNDKYSLDGRDPGGYTGIAWSIGGIHDRAWFERPVFGKIRYMNENGARKKFDVESFIKHVNKGEVE